MPSSPRLLTEAWRSWYAVANALPSAGRIAARRFIPSRILRSGHVRDPFDAAELEIYLDRYREPDRAAAASALYRYYLRGVAAGIRGAWRGRRLTVPTRLLFGVRDLYVSVKFVTLAEPNADDFETELVADSGHFIVNEKPELVVERARGLFGAE
jgi:pimeloyl-ACP methyl ester carboxylesterase